MLSYTSVETFYDDGLDGFATSLIGKLPIIFVSPHNITFLDFIVSNHFLLSLPYITPYVCGAVYRYTADLYPALDFFHLDDHPIVLRIVAYSLDPLGHYGFITYL